MKKILFLTAATGIILSTALVAFIKSPYFLSILEDMAGRGIGGSVEIGSLSFERQGRFTVNALSIKGENGNAYDLAISRVELNFRWGDLLKKHISGITLTEPDLTLILRKDQPEKEKKPLPFTFDKLSLINGRIEIHHEQRRSFELTLLNLSLDRDSMTDSASLSAAAFINDLNSEISAEAVIDMDKLNVESARVNVPAIEIEMLTGLPYFTFIKDYGLKGIAGLEADVVPEHSGTAGRTMINAALSLRSLSSHTETLRVNLGERLLNISLKGSHHTEKDRLDIDTLRVEVSQIGPWSASGTLEKLTSGNPDISLFIKGTGAVLKEIRLMLAGTAVKQLDDITVSGSAGAEVYVTGRLNAPEVKGVFTLSGESFKARNILIDSFDLSVPLDYRNGAFFIKNGSAAVKGLATVPAAKEETVFSTRNLKLLVPYFEYREPEIKSGVFLVTAETVTVTGEKSAHTEKEIRLKGTITGNTGDRLLRIDSFSLNTDVINNATGRVSIHMARPAAVDAALAYENIDVAEIARMFMGEFLKRSGLTIKGQAKALAEIRITFPEKNSPHVSGTLEAAFIDGGFSSGDETVMGERIKLDISGRIESPVSFDSADFSVSAKASGFELLAGRFYGDFSDREMQLLAEGTYTKNDDMLNIKSSRLVITGIGEILLKGSVSSPGSSASVDAKINIPVLSGGEAFDFFIRETFREQYPFLAKMRIDGQASMDVNVMGSVDRFKAYGDLHLADMKLADDDSGKSLRGLNMSLPFRVSFPETGPLPAIDNYGSLKIEEINWPPLLASGFEVFPAISSNTLTFQKDIRLPLYGGSLTVKKAAYRDILSPERSLLFAAEVNDIDLAQVGKALDMPGFSGSVKGTIPSASFTENRLETEGEILLELFDGTMRVSGLAADNVISPIASVRADIELDSINLGALTSAFEFGHISGMMRGEIRDLIIVNGQAQRFNGHIETYRKKGIDQRISVEALKKISILGSGSALSVLDRGIYRFFREYRYEQIGFRAALRNDKLLLQGVGEGNESQYLVKGGLLPPKVDVITFNKHISFKELLSRLKRISQSEKKEPVN